MHSDLELAFRLLPAQLANTIWMVSASGCLGVIIGLPLGLTLALTGKKSLKENLFLYKVLETIVNIGRSFPFAILMVALIPVTRWIVGTSLGTAASIVPLTVAAAPFAARLIETNLREVDPHLIEAGISMGSSTYQIVLKILFPEALPSLIASATMTFVNLVGYSAMAGLVGGGGLGQVAIQYGYNRFNSTIMVATVGILVLLVQAIQWTGSRFSYAVRKKRGM